MMTIVPPFSEDLTGDVLPGASGQLAKQKAKWLHELERAQWEVKQRAPSQHHNASNSATRDDATPHNSAQANSKPQDANIMQGPNRQVQPESLAHASPMFRAPTALLPTAEVDAARAVTAIANAPILPLNTLSSASASTPSSSLAFGISANSAQRQWEKQRAHLEQKDGEVRLWLRDTQVDEAQGLELAIALRKRFAEMGLKLARFTLNGQTITQDNPQSTSRSNQ